MYTKVIEVQGTRTETREDSFGVCSLYPDGTTRIVRNYHVFPRTLNGQRSGWFSAPRVLQRTEIKLDVDPMSSDYLFHNKWKDVRFLDDVLDVPTQSRA